MRDSDGGIFFMALLLLLTACFSKQTKGREGKNRNRVKDGIQRQTDWRGISLLTLLYLLHIYAYRIKVHSHSQSWHPCTCSMTRDFLVIGIFDVVTCWQHQSSLPNFHNTRVHYQKKQTSRTASDQQYKNLESERLTKLAQPDYGPDFESLITCCSAR